MRKYQILLLTVPLLIGCETDSNLNGFAESLTLISEHNLTIEGASGLALDVSGDFLWTLSDQSGGLVYKMTFEGDIIGALGYRGIDMEGITMNPKDGTLWIVEEQFRQIVQLDSQGSVLQRVEVPVQIVNENDGLEGVAIDPITEHVYIVNEKTPTEFIELNDEFVVVRRFTINSDTKFRSNFRLDDLSGLFYVSEDREFWIVSDESMRIVVTDFELNPLRSYEFGKRKSEGIAVSKRLGRVYLVNDDVNKLYVYSYQ